MKTNHATFRAVTLSLGCTFLLSGITTPASAQAAAAAAQAQPQQLSLFQSKLYVAPNTREQHYEDSMTLQPGQELLPLTLVVTNGPNGKVPFNWFRINIAGYLMASEQNLPKGRRQAAIDVTGRIQGGTSQILIDAAGEPGATLTFSLLTTPVTLEAVEPTTVMQGQTIVLHGRSFSANESQDTVLINGKPAQILSASPTSLTARVPADAAAGNAGVQVQVNGVPTRQLSISVGKRALPVLHSMNYWMAPPGAVLNIRGSNFAPAIADNKVYFKNVAAQVVSANPNLLQVIIPNWSYGPSEMNIPVWVVSKGVRSGNYLPFDIGPKYMGALPPMPGDASSEASSQASSEAGWPMDATSEASTENSSEASTQSGSEAPFSSEQGSESGSEAPGPMIYP